MLRGWGIGGWRESSWAAGWARAAGSLLWNGWAVQQRGWLRAAGRQCCGWDCVCEGPQTASDGETGLRCGGWPKLGDGSVGSGGVCAGGVAPCSAVRRRGCEDLGSGFRKCWKYRQMWLFGSLRICCENHSLGWCSAGVLGHGLGAHRSVVKPVEKSATGGVVGNGAFVREAGTPRGRSLQRPWRGSGGAIIWADCVCVLAGGRLV